MFAGLCRLHATALLMAFQWQAYVVPLVFRPTKGNYSSKEDGLTSSCCFPFEFTRTFLTYKRQTISRREREKGEGIVCLVNFKFYYFLNF